MVVSGGGPWEGRNVLVTGAAGLLGGWTIRALADRGARVVALDPMDAPQEVAGVSGVVAVRGDVRDRDLVQSVIAGGTNTVVHLGAQAIVGAANEDPVPTFEANIEGTWTLLEACRREPAVGAIVVASSDKAYGEADEPYQETTPLRPRHPYDASKACADLIAQAYAASYGVPVTISRCGNLYGGGDLNWSRIVPGTVRSVIEGRRPVIRSDGTYVRDYLYVEDAAEGVLALAGAVGERPELRGEAFNFGAGERLPVMELVGRILFLMGSRLEPDVRNEAVNEIPAQRVDSTKARTFLGWAPGHSLEDGLRRTIAWYRDHLKAAS